MSSCPVCYENFSHDGDDALTPYQLPCHDIICKGCIANDIFDESYFCPECGNESVGVSPDAIGTPISLNNEDKSFEEDYFVGRNTLSSDDNDGMSPASRDSLFAQFTKRTSGGGGGTSPSTISTGVSDRKSGRKGFADRYGVCKEHACKNKACGNDGHCFNHSSNKKQHLVQEDKLATLLARTSLDFVHINNIQRGFKSKFQSRADDWPDVNPKELIERFKRQERMELGEAMALINRARDILSHESNVLKLEAPVVAVGDIHGQYYDLLNMFSVGGDPMVSTSEYMFLGDYVDRGSFSCEVILTLLAYKVACPNKIWLIRGNHECASVSGHFGFKEECKMKYGVQLYYRFLLLFQTMPLAALVSTAYGDIFACHGGLSPDVLTIEDLDEIDRFVEPEENSALLDILWSDPISEDRVDEMTDAEYEEFISLEWRPNPTRGCSYCYGYKAVHDFLNRNSIVSLVRAHEVQENGFHKHFDPAVIESRIQQSAKYKRKMSNSVATLRRLKSDDQINYGKEAPAEEWHYPSHDIPTVITVFSAPNYCDRYDNQGAILKIAMGLDGFQFLQYACVPHPVPDVIESQMNNQITSVIQTCPYMPTSFRDFVRVAIELGHEDSLIEEGNDEDEENENALEEAIMQGRKRSTAITPPPEPEVFQASPKCSKTEPTKTSHMRKLFETIDSIGETSGDETTGIDTVETTDTIPFSNSKSEPSRRIQPRTKSHSPPRSPLPPVLTDIAVTVSPKKSTPPFQRNSSMPSWPMPKTITVSARSDTSPPRKLTHGSNDVDVDGGKGSKRGSVKSQHFRRATEVFSGQHASYTSPYRLAHASDAINELHPVRVKKYMDNFVSSKSKDKKLTPNRNKSTDGEDEDGFKERITYLTEQFDKQALINNNKFIIEDRERLSLDSLTSVRPRRSTSLNFVPSSPTKESYSKNCKQILKKNSSGKIGSEFAHASSTSNKLEAEDDEDALFKEVCFTKPEVLALRLLFSLFDRSGTSTIGYEDLVAYGEETGGLAGIRDAADALAIVDIDGDGVIGLLDFIHFAARLRDTELVQDNVA